ncbi:membrane protein [Thermococcus eurythermalis]|uniref:Membrane protein n=1 Tax=Thermococcus eurythermalis TaxID=1505907 RepID=A0A097QU53_9EURY|nr:hypothetical protein [Thermococcus eurythermalis]AIU70003.1 membrane protein [Thermococcus eurythermalis]
MNIFIPLLAGLLLGYLLKRAGKKPNLEIPTSVALLAMIFFLGVKTGEVHVDGLWLFGVSTIFAVFTVAGSLLLAEVAK